MVDPYAYYNLQDDMIPKLKPLSQLGKDQKFRRSKPPINHQMDEAESDHTVLTDEHCLIASPLVLGFALQKKEWCQLYVSNVMDIEWNLDAFNSLVLGQDEKELLLALAARERDRNEHAVEDAMYTKGRGTIMLLCGPPGVGKTLTAESVAEEVQRPLYRLGAGDLGISPNQVESRLMKALEQCARWDAVMLIDEADVFLECRTKDSLARNELVSSEFSAYLMLVNQS
jgi:ATP-dependent protease Clp ATPase subunit